MNTLTAFFLAATQALKAFPLWVAWKTGGELESLTDEIITLEDRALPSDRPRLDRLRVKKANRRKLHEALLALITPPESGTADRDDSRDLRPPGG